MPVKWKSGRFKPEVMLARIDAVRTPNPSGPGSSFAGFEVQRCLPALHSMLVFPDAAKDLDHATLIWRAAGHATGVLTKDSFLTALNSELTKALAVRRQTYHVLTSFSLDSQVRASATIDDVRVELKGKAYPTRFRASREEQLTTPRLPSQEGPEECNRVVATLDSTSFSAAFTAASRAIDLYRAVWCFLCNNEMELIGQDWNPINAVKLGVFHTVHDRSGKASEGHLFFEPHHLPKRPYKNKDHRKLAATVRFILNRIARCPYGNDLKDALLIYVRALDEPNQSAAFSRLWSALERLTSPEVADHSAVVRRSSFMWRETDFAVQMLEHLREYRNAYVHRGHDSIHAKQYCFQLQQCFRPLFKFHIGHVGRFKSLEEANEYLDLPQELGKLQELKVKVGQAIRYRTPRV